MAKKKQHVQHEEEGGEAWLLPYSDLMTLLLAVFIVLFAVSQVDETKAEQISQAFRESMMTEGGGVFSNEGAIVIPIGPELPSEVTSGENTQDSTSGEATPTTGAQPTQGVDKTAPTDSELTEFLGQTELTNLKELKSNLDTQFEQNGIGASVTTAIDMRGLVISFNNAILFESGSAEIKKDHEEVLLQVADMIRKLNNYIRIEGHTDNIPIHSDIYPSNWELSTARAVSVVRLYIDESNISPDKLVAVGYGEYRPVADNATSDGRAKNRRIDIIVLSEKYNNLED